MSAPPRKRVDWWLPALFFLAVALVAINGSSFWIDECVTARAAQNPSLIDAWREVVRLKWAEVQMPFFIAYVWAYEKAFGSGELALRLAALPFFVGGMTLLVTQWARRGESRWALALVIGLSPFAWYYLNEARLYAMQMGVTALIVAALLRLSETPQPADRSESRWLWVYLAGVVLLSAISMLGQIWVLAALLAVVVLVPRARWISWWRGRRGMLLLAAGALFILGTYYLWSLTVGARATLVGRTNVQTVLFIAYEQLGFAGLGPGRLELRESGARALKSFVPLLAAYGLMLTVVFAMGAVELWRRRSRPALLGLALCLLIPSAFILAAGMLTHFRVLGRHFTPLVVVWFLILGVGLARLWRSGWPGRGVAAAFVGLALVSCLELRFAPRHGKDDYRQAAVWAKTALAQDEVVWWNAADVGAVYYGVPLSESANDRRGAVFLMNPSSGFAAELPAPTCVITSKPDAYDSQSAMAVFLKEQGFRPVRSALAFTLWRRE